MTAAFFKSTVASMFGCTNLVLKKSSSPRLLLFFAQKENVKKQLTFNSYYAIIYEHLLKRKYIAGWSSPVARRAHNPKVVGSNPAPATKLYVRLSRHRKIVGVGVHFYYMALYIVWNIFAVPVCC